jgi:chromosome segregation ATPase
MAQMEKIVAFFTEEFPHVGLTQEMLKNPKFDIVFEAYRCLTCAIFGLPESVFAPDENGPQLPLQVVYRLMQSVINDTTTDNFLITDLINPKTQRVRFFLVSLIDFYRFIRLHVSDIDSLFEEMDQLRNKLEDDRTAIAKLGDEIEKQKQKNERSKRRRLDLASKVNQLQTELANYQKQKEQIKDNVANADDQIKKKQEKIESLESSIAEAIEECRQLDLDIVSSPDKMFAEIQKTERELTDCEEQIDHFKQQARDSARQKSDAENVNNKIVEFKAEMKASFDAKMIVVNEQRTAAKESETNLQSRKNLVFKTERNCEDRKVEAEDQFQKLKSDAQYLQENIECVKAKLLSLQHEMNKTNETFEIKDKRDKREMANKLKQLQQNLHDVEAEYRKRETSVKKLMNEISTFVKSEETEYKESKEIYEKAIGEVKNNKTMITITQLLEENVELTNRKQELESKYG